MGKVTGFLEYERKDGCVTVASIALNGEYSGGYDVDSNISNTCHNIHYEKYNFA